MTNVVERARAKINLTLNVLGRRSDGYHSLISLVAFANAGDQVRLIADEPPGLTITGPFADSITSENILERAFVLLSQAEPRLSLGHVYLDKQLPVAAGIGGGSSDAAAFLRAVRRANPEFHDRIDWMAIARRLGADVTVCFANRGSWMSGTGETLHELNSPLPELAAVLVNPMVCVPPDKTARVFQLLGAAPLDEARDAPLPDISSRSGLLSLMAGVGNDLEAPATIIVPQIADVLESLEASPGIEIARLSGAGPTCFGIFADRPAAEAAARRISAAQPGWWVRDTTIG